MKIYINHINGKNYLYASDRIFIAKSKSIQKTKSLGPADTMKNMALKKKEFYEYLRQEEARLRVEYWQPRIANVRFVKYVSVEKLESLRARLYRAKEFLGSIGVSAMETAFLVDFIYNSNRIEGSKLPRERVEQILQTSRSGNDEVNNTLKAIQYLRTEFQLNMKQVKRLHMILLAHEPEKHGFRHEPVVVGNMEVIDWRSIRKELTALFSWYKQQRMMYPPELAFTFYYRFEQIHPFIDGNGQVGRLLMNYILQQHRYHPIIVWNKRTQAHLSAFRKYIEGKSEYYFKFMAEQFVKTHEIYIEKIEQAVNIDEQMAYFMKPSPYNF